MANFLVCQFMVIFIFASTAFAFPSTGRTPRSGGPPVFVQKVETDWNTTALSKATTSFDVQAGDVLVAYAGQENGRYTHATISGGSLVWILQQEIALDMSSADAAVWTAVVGSDQTMSVTFTMNDTRNMYGGAVLTFRRSGGVGNSNQAENTGAPSLSLTTSKANSAIVVLSVDWNAVSPPHTWRTATAGSIVETTDAYISGGYTVNGGYHPNAGTAGAKTLGLSAPATQKYSIVAVEIKGQ